MAYSDPVDMKIPDVGPASATLDPAKYTSDAADEIDSIIGYRYTTPIDVTEGGSTPRPVRLLLKRLNAFLATGRFIQALTALQEDQQLNAYGNAMVEEVLASLYAIADGTVILPGLTLTDGEVTPGLGEAAPVARVTVPLINNLDAESNVEAFYDRIANPYYVYYPLDASGTGLVR